MTDAVSLSEAKAFLRVTHDAEDGLISTFLEAATTRVEGETGQVLDAQSPAALRLAVMALVAQAYEQRADGPAWVAPYRKVRL